jgi:hypothetical protein
MRTILPLLGVDNIRFGMRPSQVRAILGDRLHYEEWMGGNLNDDFLYYSGILLGFAGYSRGQPSEASELVVIELRGDQPLSLFGHHIESAAEAHLQRILTTQGIAFWSASPSAVAASRVGLTLALTKQGLLSRVSLERVPAKKPWQFWK